MTYLVIRSGELIERVAITSFRCFNADPCQTLATRIVDARFVRQ